MRLHDHETSTRSNFKQQYETHLKHLRLQGLQPKTIEAYALAIRHLGAYFDERIDDLTEAQLTDYFSELMPPIRGARSGIACTG